MTMTRGVVKKKENKKNNQCFENFHFGRFNPVTLVTLLRVTLWRKSAKKIPKKYLWNSFQKLCIWRGANKFSWCTTMRAVYTYHWCTTMKSVYLPIIDGWSIALLNSIVSRLSHSLQNCGNHDYQRFMKILGKRQKNWTPLNQSLMLSEATHTTTMAT